MEADKQQRLAETIVSGSKQRTRGRQEQVGVGLIFIIACNCSGCVKGDNLATTTRSRAIRHREALFGGILLAVITPEMKRYACGRASDSAVLQSLPFASSFCHEPSRPLS